jgi:hypothetical protein
MEKIARVVGGAVAAAGLLLWASTAGASIMTLDFPTDLQGTTGKNAIADGFRISPTCHFDTSVAGSPGIAWDRSGCLAPGSGNQQYLGPTVPLPVGSGLYIDDASHAFSLVSLDHIGFSFFAESSKGGIVQVGPSGQPSVFDFSGAAWQDIQWVLFYYNDPGAPFAGFDQMIVAVPEPQTLGIFAAGLALLLSVAGLRRARSAATAPL